MVEETSVEENMKHPIKTCAAALLATTGLLAFSSPAVTQDLVTLDRIGSPDAPNSMVFRVGVSHSNNNPRPAFAERFNELYTQFAKQHPDWQIEIQVMSGDIGGEQTRILEQARAGRAPDCAEIDSFFVPLFIANDVMQDVSGSFTQDELDALFPFVRNTITGPNGEVYAWWWNTDFRLLYRDTRLVPEAPQTWDELVDAAVAASGTGVDGILFNGGRWEGTTFDWLAHFWAQGGDLLDAEGRPIFGEGENRDKMIRAISFFERLVDEGAAPSRVATITAYDDFNAAAAAGSVAMFIGGHWQNAQLRDAMSEEDFNAWEATPIPGPTLEERSTGTGGWTFATFSDDPAVQEMCMNLVRDVYKGPANAALEQLPTSTTLFEELEFLQTPFFQDAASALAEGRARPGFPVYPEVSNQIQIMMGEVLSGTKEPEEALDDAFEAALEAHERL